MGLFSRKEAKSSRRATQRPRPSVSSEAQASSMRVRARRRLAGAVALVLAAVIVLPMLLDGDPRPVPAGIEIVVPERNAPFNPDLSPAPAVATATGVSDSAVSSGIVDGSEGSDAADATNDQTSSSTATLAQTNDSGSANAETTATGNTVTQDSAVNGQSQTANGSPATATKPADELNDQAKPGSSSESASGTGDSTAVAMAILEGRTPAAASGNYVLQIASYTSAPDAQSRVEKLKSQGVSNAFVQSATVNDKATFRLRVGPFDSRAAAQAAQARLRTLGYDNGFITTK